MSDLGVEELEEPLDAPGSLDTYEGVVAAFIEFLTVAIHLILYERDLYPRESFLCTRKYNAPVQQSRHPKVCKWIEDAVEAVSDEMLKVRRIQPQQPGFYVMYRRCGTPRAYLSTFPLNKPAWADVCSAQSGRHLWYSTLPILAPLSAMSSLPISSQSWKVVISLFPSIQPSMTLGKARHRTTPVRRHLPRKGQMLHHIPPACLNSPHNLRPYCHVSVLRQPS
jgi:hypothetical protein